MKSLNYLIGNWITKGEVIGSGNNNVAISGTDTYEWILNNKFILHKVNVIIGNEKTEAVEIISVSDQSGKKYILRSFDDQGVYNEMIAHIDDSKNLHISGDKMRAKLIKNDADNLTAFWERSEDNKQWIPWMKLNLSRAFI